MDFFLIHGRSRGAWCREPLIRELAALLAGPPRRRAATPGRRSA